METKKKKIGKSHYECENLVLLCVISYYKEIAKNITRRNRNFNQLEESTLLFYNIY